MIKTTTIDDTLAFFQARYTLRSGQRSAFENTLAHFEEGRRVLNILPTGYGKTLVEAMLAHHSYTANGRKVVIVSGRQTLANQLRDSIETYTELPTFVNYANALAKPYLRQAAAIVTLPESFKKLVLDLNGNVGLVIFDESHHAVADTWANVSKLLDGANVVGFTATPLRTDRQTLAIMFDACGVVKYITDGVAEGYLVNPELHCVTLDRGRERYGQMLNTCLHHAGEGKTIAFCESIKRAEEYSKAVNKHAGGVVSVALHSEQDEDTLTVFENDPAIRILFAVDMLREGYDNADISTVAVLRKVKSDLVYTQMIGRTTRPNVATNHDMKEDRKAAIAASSKPKAIVLEFYKSNYRVDEHPVEKILAPPKEVPVLSRWSSDRPWKKRKDTEEWQECFDVLSLEVKRLNIVKGETIGREMVELLGLAALADKLYSGSMVNIRPSDQATGRADADRIRKKAVKLKEQDPEKLFAILVDTFGEDNLKNAITCSSWGRLNGKKGVKSVKIDWVIYEGNRIALKPACREAGFDPSTVYNRSKQNGCTIQEAFDDLLKNPARPVILYNGKKTSIYAACQKVSFSNTAVYNRAKRKNCTLQEAFDDCLKHPPKHQKIRSIVYNGEKLSLGNACKKMNIRVATVCDRSKKNDWTIQEAFDDCLKNPPIAKQRHVVFYDGRNRPIQTACKKAGFSTRPVYKRAKENNWTIQKAFDDCLKNPPLIRRRRTIFYENKNMSVHAACKKAKLSPTSVYIRAKKNGWTIQEAFDDFLKNPPKQRLNMVLYAGEKMPASIAYKKAGLKSSTVHNRAKKNGWTIQKAFDDCLKNPPKSSRSPLQA